MANMIFKMMDISDKLMLESKMVRHFYILEMQQGEISEDPHKTLSDKLDALAAKVDNLKTLVFGLYRPHLLPGKKLRLNLTGETRKTIMGSYVDFLIYEADLSGMASLNSTDVERQVLTVRSSLDGGEENLVLELAKDAVKAVFEVRQNSVVRLGLYYVDDAGNKSGETYSQEFVALDTIAPDAPGDFGAITLTGEHRVEIADTPAAPEEPEAEIPVEAPAPVEETPAVEADAQAEELPAESPPEAPAAPESASDEAAVEEPAVSPEPVVEAPAAPEEPVAESPAEEVAPEPAPEASADAPPVVEEAAPPEAPPAE